MNWLGTLTKLLDRYDLKARLFPGLLILIPPLTFLVVVYGRTNPTLVSLGSVLTICGGPYLLSSFVRIRGQKAQERLFHKWGAQPTTILMRHSDSRISRPTKTRYHELVRQKLGIAMPTPTQEEADPRAADELYAAAGDALRNRTRDSSKFPLLFNELVAYGFNRNAYGSRWFGVTISIGTLLVVLIHGNILSLDNGRQQFYALKFLDLSSGITLAVATTLLCLWLFHFTPRTVEQAAFSYSLRLLESVEKITKK